MTTLQPVDSQPPLRPQLVPPGSKPERKYEQSLAVYQRKFIVLCNSLLVTTEDPILIHRSLRDVFKSYQPLTQVQATQTSRCLLNLHVSVHVQYTYHGGKPQPATRNARRPWIPTFPESLCLTSPWCSSLSRCRYSPTGVLSKRVP